MFNIRNWGDAMLGLCITYIILLGLTTGFYFWLVPKDGAVASDIVNISLCASTLLGPIILVFTLSAWKEQHNKGMSAQIVRDIVSKLCELHVYLLNFDKDFLLEAPTDKLNAVEKLELLKKDIANWSDLLKYQEPLIKILLNNSSLSEKLIILENQIGKIILVQMEGYIPGNRSDLKEISRKMEEKANAAKTTLMIIFNELEVYYRA